MKTLKYLISFVIMGMLCLGTGCSDGAKLSNLPVKVQVQRVEPFNASKTFSYSGTIEAVESTPLSFAVNGTVLRVYVSEGDFAKKRQLLAELNDATFKNAFEMAQATLKRAEDAYKRLKPMYDRGSLPEIKFVEVETGLEQAQAAAAIAQKSLNDCKLYAPIDGFVGKRSIEPGMNVLPGLATISLLDIDKVYARVSVSENEIAQIDKGKEASITVGALNGRTFQGTVEEVGVLADPIAHTYKVKISLFNGDHAIKPGMICEAKIMTSDTINGIVVPNQAVRVDEKGKAFVYIVDRNNALRKYVEIGRLVNGGIEIRSGLNVGELVVVAGQQKLVDNSPVQVVD